MTEESEPRRRGRPATGVTPKRNIRMGEAWAQGEELAGQLGMTMTAYVEDAIQRQNARVEREFRRKASLASPGDYVCAECGMPVPGDPVVVPCPHCPPQ